MKLIGNIIWFFTGGLISGILWAVFGLIWCITVVGIPIGLQCFKFSALSFAPFGKNIVYGGGAVKFIVNILWLITSGIPMAMVYAGCGIAFCCTIIGIPFGLQMFKFAKLALMPVGAEIV